MKVPGAYSAQAVIVDGGNCKDCSITRARVQLLRELFFMEEIAKGCSCFFKFLDLEAREFMFSCLEVMHVPKRPLKCRTFYTWNQVEVENGTHCSIISNLRS
jgi:hypothetical protein